MLILNLGLQWETNKPETGRNMQINILSKETFIIKQIERALQMLNDTVFLLIKTLV